MIGRRRQCSGTICRSAGGGSSICACVNRRVRSPVCWTFAQFAPSLGAHVAPEALHTAVLAALALACALSLLAMFVSAQRAFRDGFHYHPA